jgi:hypothetical protein
MILGIFGSQKDARGNLVSKQARSSFIASALQIRSLEVSVQAQSRKRAGTLAVRW